MGQARRKHILLLLLCLFSLVFALLPQPTHATSYNPTRYFNVASFFTNNYVTGHVSQFLGTAQDPYGVGYDYFNRTNSATGNRTTYLGIKVSILAWEGTPTIISGVNPIAIVSRTINGEGLQSATWDCPEITLLRNETLLVQVYSRFSLGSIAWTVLTGSVIYTLDGEYLTENLGSTTLNASTWTVTYYTGRNYPDTNSKTNLQFYYGTADYDSKIENIQYDDGVTAPIIPEENITAMVPFFIMGALIMLPIGLLLGKKT